MEPREYDRMRAIEERHWWFLARRRIVGSLLLRLLGGQGGRLLDFGCGCGGNTEFFSKLPGLDVVGVDASEHAVRYCRERGLSNVELIPTSGWKPEPESFDAAIATDVLEHIDDHVGALRTLWSAVKPGGFVLVTVPAFPFLWSAHDVSLHHFRRYRTASLDALARDAGLPRWTWRGYFNGLLFPPVAAIRLARRLAPARAEDARSDTTSVPPAILNKPLEAIFASERFLIGRLPMPFGVSMVAWARKPEG